MRDLPVVVSPTTPSKKETLVTLGSPRSSFSKVVYPTNALNNSYVPNPNERLIATLEEEEVCCFKRSLQSLIEFMFPYESLYFGCKPRDYYEAILIDTGSMNITHIRNQHSNRK